MLNYANVEKSTGKCYVKNLLVHKSMSWLGCF